MRDGIAERIAELQRQIDELRTIEIPTAGGGAGDMYKATYDVDNNGVVDDSEALGGVAAADYLTEAEHTAIGDSSPHHAAVTLKVGHDAALSLIGQELDLADVLTPTEHTAIGDGAPHHAAVTLDVNADTLLGLSTQQLGLDTQAANRAFAGPASGAAAVPTFRALVAADLPAATESAQGAAELATVAEVKAGADTTRIVTAAGLAGVIKLATPASDGGIVKSGAGTLTLSAGGAYTLTVAATGTAALGAGTLTAATANDVTGATHTHAITSTADGDTNVSTLLASGAAGDLRVDRLGVGVAVIAATGTLALPDAGYIGNGAATARLIFDSSGSPDVIYAMGSYFGVGGVPVTPLHIQSSVPVITLTDTDTGGDSQVSASSVSGSLILGADVNNEVASSVMTFRVDDTERARISTDGNFLVGTTTDPTANDGKVIVVGDNAANPTMGANTAGFFGKDVGGTVEAFAVDEAGNVQQLTPHNYTMVDPLPGVLHWAQYQANTYAGIEKTYDMERALLALEALTGEKFIYTRRTPRQAKPSGAPEWLRRL